MTKKLQDKINAAVGLTEDKLPGEVQDLGPEADIGKTVAAKQKKADFPTSEAGDTTSKKLEGEVQDLGSEDAGKAAASKESKQGLPDAKGAGNSPGYVDVTDKFTIKLKESIESVINEELDISPESRAKIVDIFESAVIARTNQAVDTVKEKLEEQYSQDLEVAISDMVEKVDAYLSFGVNSWKQDNKLAIESGIRQEISESLMTKVFAVFQEHNITVPEGADDLVVSLNSKVDNLNEMYNDSVKTSIALQKENTELKRVSTLREITEGMADSEKDKLTSLVEGITFEDAESYTTKINSVKDSYFGKSGKIAQINEGKQIVGRDIALDESNVQYADPVKAAAANLAKRYKKQ